MQNSNVAAVIVDSPWLVIIAKFDTACINYIVRGKRTRWLRRNESFTPESASGLNQDWKVFPAGIDFQMTRVGPLVRMIDLRENALSERTRFIRCHKYLRPTPQEMQLQNNTPVQDGECYPYVDACAYPCIPSPPSRRRDAAESWDLVEWQDLSLDKQSEKCFFVAK